MVRMRRDGQTSPETSETARVDKSFFYFQHINNVNET